MVNQQPLKGAYLLFVSSIICVQGFYARSTSFVVNNVPIKPIRPMSHKESFLILRATVDDETSFSKRKESPLGVRRRVKAVLEKARSRTGIRNSSTDSRKIKTKQTASSILADAASIGGLSYENDTTVSLEYQVSQSNGFEPDELLVVKKPGNTKKKKDKISSAELIAINADMPAAYAEPLPFTLPSLSARQKRRLEAGERIQEQSKMGREGSGYVVLDINAPPPFIWECLLDFESYPDIIPTVRDVQFFSSENLKSGYYAEKPIDPSTGRELRHYGTPSTTRAAFILSKFRLNIAAIHNYRPHPDGHYMDFSLDPECTNIVLKSAKGIWHTQSNPDGRGEDWTRVYLICELRVSRVLPAFVVDYASKRAMPRATSWLKPQVETASKLWLKNGPFPQTSIRRNGTEKDSEKR